MRFQNFEPELTHSQSYSSLRRKLQLKLSTDDKKDSCE